MSQSTYHVAVFRGDGIGPDVTDATIAVLEAVQKCVNGFRLNFSSHHAGATYFRESGRDIEQTAEQAAEVSQYAEGIIVGSALIDVIEQNSQREEKLEAAGKYIASLKSAMDNSSSEENKRG